MALTGKIAQKRQAKLSEKQESPQMLQVLGQQNYDAATLLLNKTNEPSAIR